MARNRRVKLPPKTSADISPIQTPVKARDDEKLSTTKLDERVSWGNVALTILALYPCSIILFISQWNPYTQSGPPGVPMSWILPLWIVLVAILGCQFSEVSRKLSCDIIGKGFFVLSLQIVLWLNIGGCSEEWKDYLMVCTAVCNSGIISRVVSEGLSSGLSSVDVRRRAGKARKKKHDMFHGVMGF